MRCGQCKAIFQAQVQPWALPKAREPGYKVSLFLRNPIPCTEVFFFLFFFFAVCVAHTILVPCVCVINCFSHVQLCNPLNCSSPGPLSMGFSRQEYQMGCQFLLQGIFPGIEPAFLMSPALAGRFLTTSTPW